MASESFKNLYRRRTMRLATSLVLIAGLLVFFGVISLFSDRGGESRAQSQLEKPALWGDEVVVHAGKINQYSRNGYSTDYDEINDWIWAAVSEYSTGPDTCNLYVSTNGGTTWILNGYIYSEFSNDLSNPQVVTGDGSNPYLFWFVLDQHLGELILYRKLGLTGDKYTICDGNESFSATRDDPGSNYYLYLARAKNTKETIFMYSSNFGVNWQSKDTVDGDMPSLTTAGTSTEDVYLAWRLDGGDGALYGARDSSDHAFVRKNLGPGVGGWKYYPVINPYTTTYSHTECLLQASDGMIYAGIDTQGSGSDKRAAVLKSQDGGETWTLTDGLGTTEGIDDLLEGSDGALYAALTQEVWPSYRARVYKTTDGGANWSNTGTVGSLGDEGAHCLARSAGGTIYVGTGYQGDVFKTTDGGSDWDECADLAGASDIRALLVTQAGTVIAGGISDSSGFYRSTNGGQSWNLIKPASAPYYVSLLFQASDGILLAGVGKPSSSNAGVMKSTNDGVTWTWTSFNSPGSVWSIVERSNSWLYLTDGLTVYRSINHGDDWTQMSGAPGLYDLILSKPQIAVKKSTNRGVTWGSAEKLSTNLYDKSDPKAAGPRYPGTIAVWVAYSEKNVSGDWNLRYAYSTGSTWSKGHSLAGGSGSDKQLCDLRCARGSPTVHAAYYSDETGSRKLYYKYATTSDPSSWSDTLCISGILPTTYHTPEISFYGYNPVIFFCGQTIGLPPQYPNNLYVDAQQFTAVGHDDEELSRPNEFSLSQNYPNPFNPETRMSYFIPKASRVRLEIFNILGQKIKTLVDENQAVGRKEVTWDGRDHRGQQVASGVYLYRLQADDLSQSRKMVLMR
jgi:hypothetical protein